MNRDRMQPLRHAPPHQPGRNPAWFPNPRRRPWRGGRPTQRGAEVLEAALAVPIFLMIVFALYSLARGWDIHETMTRAAREGVRKAVTTNCATCGNAYYTSDYVQSNFVLPALAAAGLNAAQVENYKQGYTWLDTAHEVCGAYISFGYPYRLMVPFTPVTVTDLTLETDVQMRLENQPNDGTCP